MWIVCMFLGFGVDIGCCGIVRLVYFGKCDGVSHVAHSHLEGPGSMIEVSCAKVDRREIKLYCVVNKTRGLLFGLQSVVERCDADRLTGQGRRIGSCESGHVGRTIEIGHAGIILRDTMQAFQRAPFASMYAYQFTGPRKDSPKMTGFQKCIVVSSLRLLLSTITSKRNPNLSRENSLTVPADFYSNMYRCF
jgi:hypothetical protein